MIEKRTFGGIVADIIIWIIVGALALSPCPKPFGQCLPDAPDEYSRHIPERQRRSVSQPGEYIPDWLQYKFLSGNHGR